MDDLILQSRPAVYNHIRRSASLSRLDSKGKAPDSTAKAGSPLALLSRTLGNANHAWQAWRCGLSPEELQRCREIEETRRSIVARVQAADNYRLWEQAARELDDLEGNNDWKDDTYTGDYNPSIIETRLIELEEAITSCDTRTLMYLVRTALSRDLGGMGNVDLYRHSYTGTKRIIERYVASAIAAIETVVSHGSIDRSIEHRDLLESMLYARQSFGRSALLLSGGGTFGMAHTGVLKALFHAKLLPRIISGASAGSIVCAVMCTRTDEELPALMEEFSYGDLAVFEEEGGDEGGILGHLRRLLTEGSWSDIKHLTRVMRTMTCDMTFQEAYNRTRRILNICVSTESVYELPRLLNYVTAPNVLIWSAVAASCSVPVIFNASPLLAKDPATGEHQPWNPTPEKWIDGSVDNDLPMTRLAEMFNVNHFIVSQVNPHVVPFLSKDDHLSPVLDPTKRMSSREGGETDWVQTLTTLARDEALHRLHFMAELGIMPNVATKFRSILSQKYSGDINILPEISLHDLPNLLSNPSTDFMLRMSLAGERATWPKLSRVRDRCAIELALDSAVHRLRTRVVFSESQQDLRTMRSSFASFGSQTTASSAGAASLIPTTASVQKTDVRLAVASPHRRKRRQSGGNILTLADRRRRDQLDGDDKPNCAKESKGQASPQTHVLELPPPELVLHGAGKGESMTLGKPRLRRAVKSYQQVSQHRRLQNSPIADP